jgi:hypothetical protein
MVCCATVNVVSSAPTSRRTYNSPQPLHPTAQSSSSSVLSPPKSTLFCRTFSPSLSHLPVQSSPLSSLRSRSELPSDSLQPGAALSGSLHRKKQEEQAFPVRRARILTQSLAEREMLRFGVCRETGRVGGKESERRCFVLAVFGKVEMDATDQVPSRIAGFRNSSTPQFASDNSSQNDRSSSCQRSLKTAAYSAPIVGGAASTNWSNSELARTGT